MAYSRVLLVIIFFSIGIFAYAKDIISFLSALESTNFTNIEGPELEAFNLGKEIFNSTLSDAVESAKNETLGKLDTVQAIINELQHTVIDMSFRDQLQLALVKTESFDQSTKNRIRDAKNAITATSAEHTLYFKIILDNLGGYLDKLYEIIPNVTQSSMPYENTTLDMISEKTMCHLTKMQNFSAYIHTLVLCGISFETMLKTTENINVSLAVEKTFWTAELKQFRAAVAVQVDACIHRFQNMYLDDIQQKYVTLDSILSRLASRYSDKFFFAVELRTGTEIFVSNTTTQAFKCVVNADGSCTITCYIYHVIGSNCDEMIAFKITGTDYTYKMTDGKFIATLFLPHT
ncbi:hypothetical protein DPMN_148546 [Dreissena polymorpha]|uniref:Uncharacterized protein n=1 Tax=Dreissena polymorpha TaxID=45954 RepID=A0A9D4FBY1_DREPO|nr:hypothetical protein DPMN_148546 [Dreissena polymorpha]